MLSSLTVSLEPVQLLCSRAGGNLIFRPYELDSRRRRSRRAGPPTDSKLSAQEAFTDLKEPAADIFTETPRGIHGVSTQGGLLCKHEKTTASVTGCWLGSVGAYWMHVRDLSIRKYR